MGFAASKTVNKLRNFKKVSADKMEELKKEQIKRRTFSKLQWAVKAYREWRSSKMVDVHQFDVRIYESDLDRVELLERDSFEYAMCQFLAEVTKLDGTDFPGKTLYHLVVSIQKYLHYKGKTWKLIEDASFHKLRTVLDNLMKERAANQIGTVKKQAAMISQNVEDKLWESGILGEQNPDKLRSTVLFFDRFEHRFVCRG